MNTQDIIINYLNNHMKIHKVNNAIIILPNNLENIPKDLLNINTKYKIIHSTFKNNNLILDVNNNDKKYKGNNKINNTLNKYVKNLQNIVTINKINAINDKQIIRNINHQFKTPLNGLSMGIQILDASLEDIYYKNIINNLFASCVELSKYINDIIDYYLLINNKITFDINNYDIKKNIHEIINKYEATIKERKIMIDINICENCIICNDGIRINQIIHNLIDNAIKYTQNKIAIKIWNDKNYYFFNITDNGFGIPIKEKNNIYKPFYQINKHILSGLGLGLTISKLIIDKLGGTIEILSCSKEFNILFSINNECYIDQSIKKITNTKIEHLKNKILIVEDNIINSELLKLMIAKYTNDDITIINDSCKVIETIMNENYKYIFLDIIMPNIDGYYILDYLNQNKPEILQNILIITALISDEIKKRLKQYNVKQIISKPIQLKEISKIFC